AVAVRRAHAAHEPQAHARVEERLPAEQGQALHGGVREVGEDAVLQGVVVRLPVAEAPRGLVDAALAREQAPAHVQRAAHALAVDHDERLVVRAVPLAYAVRAPAGAGGARHAHADAESGRCFTRAETSAWRTRTMRRDDGL